MLPTHVVALAGRNDAEAILDMMLQVNLLMTAISHPLD